MYTPPSFVENDLRTLHDFMDQNSFATLISAGEQEPFASHLPLLIERDRGTQGVLAGHFARANPHWQMANGQRVLVIFHGPHAYISPGWVQSKTMVPTWNYVAVHAYGVLRIVDHPDCVRDILTRMVSRYESSREQPWTMDLADQGFIEKLTSAIVGFEVEIDRLEGKWKLSQNHPAERREQIVTGLLETERNDELQIARLMKDLPQTA
ncbi:MAG: FMN-binding negative transcriptional regulator [Planctomycetaceae bacterium]